MSNGHEQEPIASAVRDLDGGDVYFYLADAIIEAGSQRAFAAKHGMSSAYVSDVVRGVRYPGPAILEALGLEKVVVYRRKA